MAKIVIFIGSVRADRQGIKAAKLFESKLVKRGHIVDIVDPMESQLSLLNKMYKEMNTPSKELQKLHHIIKDADGFVPITPEYNHSTSSALKNTLDYFQEEYFFKPTGIVSYSVGGFGGIIAAQQLRIIFAELGAPAISSSLPISKIQDVIDDEGNLKDEKYDSRIEKFLNEFDWYIEAFKNQRKKGTPY